jgi:transcription elongation factor Elf1
MTTTVWFECPKCGTEFSCEFDHGEHAVLDVPVQCEVCEETFSNEQVQKWHDRAEADAVGRAADDAMDRLTDR